MRGWMPRPDRMPILSPGRHRSPRRGACFMEFASYLAGERWSDHPECTHRTLALLARMVNDRTSEAGRARLTAATEVETEEIVRVEIKNDAAVPVASVVTRD